jgi:hypothetical protein
MSKDEIKKNIYQLEKAVKTNPFSPPRLTY